MCYVLIWLKSNRECECKVLVLLHNHLYRKVGHYQNGKHYAVFFFIQMGGVYFT